MAVATKELVKSLALSLQSVLSNPPNALTPSGSNALIGGLITENEPETWVCPVMGAWQVIL